MFLAALSLASVVYVLTKPSMLGFVISGFFFGVAALSRGNILFAAIGTALWLVFQKEEACSSRGALLRCAAFSAGLFTVVGLVFIRNYRVSGDFVPLTSNAGLNFFIGNNPNTVGTYIEPPFLHGIPDEEFADSKRAAERFAGRKFTKASEVSRFWFRQGLNFISNMPGLWLKLLWRKVFLALNWFEIPETYSFYYFKERYWSLSAAFLGYGLIAPLGVLGAAVCFVRGNFSLLHVFFFTYVISLSAFFITSRYRFPLIIPLIIFSAVLLAQGVERLKSRSWGGVRSVLISFAGIAAFCRWTPGWMKYYVVSPSLATPHTIAGYLHLQPAGNVQLAINELEIARGINPGEPNIYAQLGAAYERVGRLDAAVVALQEAVRRNRYFHEAYNNLAMLYYHQGNYLLALQAIRSAMELRPDEPLYQRNYQMMTALPARKPGSAPPNRRPE